MIIALKMLIVVVWVGAGFSKFGKHFSNVIPPMVSNTPIRAQMGATGPLPRLRARHAAVAAGGLHGTRQRHHGRNRRPADPVLLHEQVGDAGCGAVDGGVPPVHHLDLPAGGAAGMERRLRLRHGLPVPRLPEPRRIRPVEHVAALAGPRSSPPVCCSTRSWAICGRTRCPSCPRCGNTRATGPRRCGPSRPVPSRS